MTPFEFTLLLIGSAGGLAALIGTAVKMLRDRKARKGCKLV
jgi:hypothetical protein